VKTLARRADIVLYFILFLLLLLLLLAFSRLRTPDDTTTDEWMATCRSRVALENSKGNIERVAQKKKTITTIFGSKGREEKIIKKNIFYLLFLIYFVSFSCSYLRLERG
jgi:hypothetical protein